MQKRICLSNLLYLLLKYFSNDVILLIWKFSLAESLSDENEIEIKALGKTKKLSLQLSLLQIIVTADT